MFKIPLDVNGVLAITPRPRGGDWLEDDVRRWSLHGVGIIVSLLNDDENGELALEQEASLCRAIGIDFVSLPVPDLGVPSDAAAFIARVHALAARLRDGASVAVHCRQSVGRSGLLSVSIAVACGCALPAAIDLVTRARGVTVPETAVQREWLRAHVSSLAGAAATS